MVLHISPKPKQRVYVVTKGEEHLPLNKIECYWVFGPRTRYKWPSGDFHTRGLYPHTEESAWALANLLRQPDVIVYDPDLQMDKGL